MLDGIFHQRLEEKCGELSRFGLRIAIDFKPQVIFESGLPDSSLEGYCLTSASSAETETSGDSGSASVARRKSAQTLDHLIGAREVFVHHTRNRADQKR